MARQHQNFTYVPCVKEDSHLIANAQDNIYSATLENLGNEIADTVVYLCGNPSFVTSLRKKIFLQGVKSSNIYCDPFIERTIEVKPSELA